MAILKSCCACKTLHFKAPLLNHFENMPSPKIYPRSPQVNKHISLSTLDLFWEPRGKDKPLQCYFPSHIEIKGGDVVTLSHHVLEFRSISLVIFRSGLKHCSRFFSLKTKPFLHSLLIAKLVWIVSFSFIFRNVTVGMCHNLLGVWLHLNWMLQLILSIYSITSFSSTLASF